MKVIYIILGFIMLALGIVGAFLPILPTVPFLIVASWCFAKGSERFDKWFKSTNMYKKYLYEFEKDKTMKKSSKIKILIFTTALFAFLFFRYNVLPMRIAILVLMSIKYYVFIFVIKNRDESKKNEKNLDNMEITME